ncbi:hypothetical protein BKA64DRAFT_767991 [Cadophora sp. MPI-SDFR-AT-0126]|nr:hypothetical protein BKA64DRAFT_767991 [Leotiomycetes sp. MPI-SDFR-AT-0126]
MKHFIVVYTSLSLLAGLAFAITDKEVEALVNGAYITNKTPHQVCTMTSAERARTWRDSGAGYFMAGYLATRGTGEDWLQDMEHNTTAGGDIQPTLNCVAREAACSPPEPGQCEKTTPPAFFWIRLAASNLHTAIAAMHEALQDKAISNTLELNMLLEDFASKILEQDAEEHDPGLTKILNIVGASLGIVSGAFGAGSAIMGAMGSKLAAPAAGIGSGVIGAGANGAWYGAGRVTNPAAQKIADQIVDSLTRTNDYLQSVTDDFGALVFASEENRDKSHLTLDMIRRKPFGSYLQSPHMGLDIHPIAQFFDLGDWIDNAWTSSDGGLAATKKSMLSFVQSTQVAIIAQILRELRIYIVRDSSSDGRNNCWETGSRWLWENSWCYTLRRAKSLPGYAQHIDIDVIRAFDKHGIDLTNVFINADTCQQQVRAATNDQHAYDDGVSWTKDINGGTAIQYDGGYPRCLWGGLPVFTITAQSRDNDTFATSVARDGPCISDTPWDKFPANLNIHGCPINPEPQHYPDYCRGKC